MGNVFIEGQLLCTCDLREEGMSNYDIDIKKLQTRDENGNIVTEIWAEITNKETYEIIHQRIWWEDGDGVFHDATANLPIELREDVDNAWIEKSRKW